MFETRTDRLCGKVSAGNLRWPEKDSGSTRDAERRRNNGSRAPAGEMRPAEEERWEGDEKPGAARRGRDWQGGRRAVRGRERTRSAGIESPTRRRCWRSVMKRIVTFACLATIALASCGAAQAKGCIKGAIVGGVAGHMAGHGKLGAAAGCAIGHHEANKSEADKNAGQPPPDHK